MSPVILPDAMRGGLAAVKRLSVPAKFCPALVANATGACIETPAPFPVTISRKRNILRNIRPQNIGLKSLALILVASIHVIYYFLVLSVPKRHDDTAKAPGTALNMRIVPSENIKIRDSASDKGLRLTFHDPAHNKKPLPIKHNPAAPAKTEAKVEHTPENVQKPNGIGNIPKEADSAPKEATAPVADSGGTLPSLSTLRRQALKNVGEDMEKSGGRLAGGIAGKPTIEDKIEKAAKEAQRADCRTKYVSPDANILMAIVIAVETVRDKGCKW